MKYDKKIFAHNAKIIRLLAGHKQIEFSKIIGLPIKTIGAIEEIRSVTPEILLKYSEFAGTDINDLLLNKMENLTQIKRIRKSNASTNN